MIGMGARLGDFKLKAPLRRGFLLSRRAEQETTPARGGLAPGPSTSLCAVSRTLGHRIGKRVRSDNLRRTGRADASLAAEHMAQAVIWNVRLGTDGRQSAY